jgi:hypothetical protein
VNSGSDDRAESAKAARSAPEELGLIRKALNRSGDRIAKVGRPLRAGGLTATLRGGQNALDLAPAIESLARHP